ncbi:hypothetical protein [Fluoribacter gormanii]|uniref:Transmembrane protein n=1 Tax=Fluoribacter gormanii TaxID=464 RepID=A0A377GML1_9GAMM|nr:hypothetical protein [Fluoribacter gormanii]KTD05679.1 hypothetical protein Lgor_0164 [Fluoribacter gormanii]MCW8442537.1 hypothetical protein [Fluoribacter gormanii]SIQ64240.1 hypothetical protein SAMN05421777_102111 [Fluoribacter gormanii]STO25854.1 Uncharacterised protein [Fluoribacter gormanii]
MKKQASKYYILVLLVVIFVAPGVAAYLFYQHPSWLGATRVNKGTLLNPPVMLNALDGTSKWRIIFWSPEACAQECMKQLNMLARVRLALGRKLYQVDQWLLLSDKASALSQEQQSYLKEIDFKVARLSAAEVSTKGTLSSETKVFIADPGNYLILSYTSQVNPNDVYKDLKLLLNTTENKSD